MTKNLIDNYNRNLNYLRISITDRCNLRCKYCTPLTPETMLSHKDILRYEEILRFVSIGIRFGINKVRVTGGEPLVRHGVYDFLATLTSMDGLKDVSLTTNGVLLKDNLDNIKNAGIRRINVSLDSLESENFRNITGKDHFKRVWDGLHAALEYGFNPVKVNVVALPGMNEHELLHFAELSIRYPFHIRFIEYMPIGNSSIDKQVHLLTPEIKNRVSSLGELIPIESDENDGPAFRYRFHNAKGELGFISPISNHFCARCNRLRLTADGNLRTCLLSDHQIDLKDHLRNGGSDKEIEDVLLDAIRHKQRRHNINYINDSTVHTQMSSIGG